eukprot:scaffold50185_cov59-Phaeocystis_antarctica.AAC.1
MVASTHGNHSLGAGRREIGGINRASPHVVGWRPVGAWGLKWVASRLRYEHEREKHCHQLASVEARLLLNLDRDEHAAELVARGLRGVSLIGTKAMWWPAISHVPRSFVKCLYVFGR